MTERKTMFQMFEQGEFPLEIQEKLEQAYNLSETKEEGLFKAGFLCHAIMEKLKKKYEREFC